MFLCSLIFVQGLLINTYFEYKWIPNDFLRQFITSLLSTFVCSKICEKQKAYLTYSSNNLNFLKLNSLRKN